MSKLNDWNAVVIDGEIYERRKVIKSGKHVVITLPMHLWRYVWGEPSEVGLDIYDGYIIVKPVPESIPEVEQRREIMLVTDDRARPSVIGYEIGYERD